MTNPEDASVAALAVLRDERSPTAERHLAFERLLQLEAGWWGKGSLLLFAQACALATSRRVLGQYGLSPDAVDWESAAEEALMALSAGRHTIENPRAWLIGTIRNRLKNLVRESWPELLATRTEELPAERHPRTSDDAPPEVEPTDAEDRQLFYDVLLEAIQGLPPALRQVAQLIYIEGRSPQEIGEVLGVSPATARQRLHRMQLRIRSDLTARLRK
jgi:RNA polymerase sigma factor (sigma-70 family)